MTANDVPPDVLAKVRRLKSYFPYRIAWAVYSPTQKRWDTGIDKNRRRINKRLRAGELVFTL